MAEERRGASDRLKEIASQAVSAEKVRAAFATKLVAIGLTLICFAGGLDYFSAGDDFNKALAGIARESGQGALVDDLQKVGGRWAAFKATLFALLPNTLREYVVLAALLPGAGVFVWGIRIKIGTGTLAERGRALWDLGRIVLGPGLVGTLAFVVVTAQRFPNLRRTTAGFVSKVGDGTLTWKDVVELTGRYHAWAWAQVGPVLVLGLAMVVAALALGRLSGGRVALDTVRRAAWSGACLALSYYALVTVVAVASYGAGLNSVTWPWKVRPMTFLLTLALMAAGAGVAWTGRALMRRAATEGADAPADELAPAKKGKK